MLSLITSFSFPVTLKLVYYCTILERSRHSADLQHKYKKNPNTNTERYFVLGEVALQASPRESLFDKNSLKQNSQYLPQHCIEQCMTSQASLYASLPLGAVFHLHNKRVKQQKKQKDLDLFHKIYGRYKAYMCHRVGYPLCLSGRGTMKHKGSLLIIEQRAALRVYLLMDHLLVLRNMMQ